MQVDKSIELNLMNPFSYFSCDRVASEELFCTPCDEQQQLSLALPIL